MSFEDKFLKAVDEINKNNYNYGNDVLYSAFNFDKDILPKPGGNNYQAKLSSAIWLIGKSYSADPTRSSVGFVKNNGIGSAFDTIADKMVKNEDYENFYKCIEGLKSKKFTFEDTDDNDQNILKDCVRCVNLLNKMIKDAMGDDSKNVISFCSKFLHFISPNVFFIIDSFSLDGGIGLFSGRTNRTLNSKNGEYIDIDSKNREVFKDWIPSFEICNFDEYDDEIIIYAKHCIRAYALAKYLYKKLPVEEKYKNINFRYITRLVDSVLMRVTKIKESSDD